MLDEGTAAAEAMLLAHNQSKKKNIFLVDKEIFPQTLKVLETRAEPLDIKIKLVDYTEAIPLEYFEECIWIISSITK